MYCIVLEGPRPVKQEVGEKHFGDYLSEELLQQRCGPAMVEVPLLGRVTDVSSVQQQG